MPCRRSTRAFRFFRGAPLFLSACFLALTGCVNAVDANLSLARDHGFRKEMVRGRNFDHVVFFNEKVRPGTKRLHVYIEGDGTPWIHHQFVSKDPTAARPLMLRLMTLDKAPAAYLGRPCYNGLATDPACQPWLWTQGRYSKQVVESMAAVLRLLSRRYPHAAITLIGHSGGGTLAMLIAPHVNAVDQVVTLSPNLDITAWTQKHGYIPLTGSINPASQPPLPKRITQFHYLGGKDRNIPMEAVLKAVKKQKNAHVFIEPECGHKKGWERKWPAVLNKIKADAQN